MTTDRSSTASHAPRIVDKSARSRIKLSDLRAILSLEAADDGQSALVRAAPGVTIAELTRFAGSAAPAAPADRARLSAPSSSAPSSSLSSSSRTPRRTT